MKRILLWGTGQVAETLWAQCQTLSQYELLGFIDNNTEKQGSGNRILEICSTDDLPRYYIQILVSSDPIKYGSSELKGFKDVEYYRDGGLYKYAIGVADTLEDAQVLLRKVRKSFPESFIIKMRSGKRVDFIKP